MGKPTNDERRDVARKLREIRESAWDFREQLSDEGIDVFCDDQADYYLIHKAATGCIPAEHMHPCDYAELHDRLADLIEPEPERTCRDVSTVKGKFTCSECHQSWRHEEMANGKIAYCPSCVAQVMK